jgi:GLPGLI family protein
MISMACIKKIFATGALILIASISFGQMTAGKIVFERKTNLKKLFGDNPRVKQFLKKDVKWKIEDFELYFDGTSTAFLPVESDEVEEGFMKYLTSHNTIYKNYDTREKLIILDMWGTETNIKDSITTRQWKVTDSKRKIGGYVCRKSIWEMNDSTRIYAWFAPDIVPSIGPEGFDGLPGAILGLATEDGSVIYFAKSVEAMKPPEEKLIGKPKGKDIYTVPELKVRLLEKMGQWVKEDDLDAMFSWL